MKKILMIVFFIVLFSFNALADNEIILTNQMNNGQEIEIRVETGEEYLHKFVLIPFLPFIGPNTPPQIAFWAEDQDGNYLETIYVSKKAATRSFASEKLSEYDIERLKSLLPYWSHKRGELNEYGYYYPTRNKPLADTVTSATPETNFNLKSILDRYSKKIFIFAEFNNSTDWNDYYTKEAEVGEENYNGGKAGSGQPSLIYSVEVDMNLAGEYEMELVGHGSADGSNGNLFDDISNITSAKEIVGKITINIEK